MTSRRNPHPPRPAAGGGGAVRRGRLVSLRRPAARDADELIALVRGSAPFHRHRVSPPRDRRQFESWLARCRRDDHEGFLIRRNADETIVGAINLSQIFGGNFKSAYLGYWIGAPFAARGYMSEALDLVLRHAFRTLRLHRLEANIQPENEASLALLRHAGFAREGFSRRYLKISGRWADHERWAILREDWKARFGG